MQEKQKTVTLIPASFQEGSATLTLTHKRVAGYARVSTEKDEQFSSYDSQIDYYTKYIRSHEGWEFVKIYTDEGITGTSTKPRQGFNEMVSDALDGKIDLIVTKSISRFARNTVDSLTTIRKLKEVGCECFFEKENVYTFDSKGELLITILSSLAQEESRSISENVTWGIRKRFSDGKYSMHYSEFLGYEKGADGLPSIVPKEASVVRRIYLLSLQGYSPSDIARFLSRDGVPTPSGKNKWYSSVVKSILQNEKYRGDALLQKTYSIDFLSKKRLKNEGKFPQYFVENGHEGIVSKRLFERVQKNLPHTEGRKPKCPIVCERCGKRYRKVVLHSGTAYEKRLLRCNKLFRRGCPSPYLKEGDEKRLYDLARETLLKDPIWKVHLKRLKVPLERFKAAREEEKELLFYAGFDPSFPIKEESERIHTKIQEWEKINSFVLSGTLPDDTLFPILIDRFVVGSTICFYLYDGTKIVRNDETPFFVL